jgi:hypothetical protein
VYVCKSDAICFKNIFLIKNILLVFFNSKHQNYKKIKKILINIFLDKKQFKKQIASRKTSN